MQVLHFDMAHVHTVFATTASDRGGEGAFLDITPVAVGTIKR